jgi:hypothetical protein
MGKSSLVGLAVLLFAASAQAEVGSPPPAAPATPVAPAAPAAPAAVEAPAAAEAPAAPAAVEAPAAPAAPLAPTRLPPAFMDQFLTYDETEGGVFVGKGRRPLARDDFFTAVGRPDLLAKSHEASRRRLILAISGGAVLATGVTMAVVAWSGAPDLNSAYCVQSPKVFNEVCVPDSHHRDIIAASGLVGGIAIGTLLGALAYWSSPNILSHDDTAALVAKHNAGLLKRLRAERSDLSVVPYASLQGGGFAASFRF